MPATTEHRLRGPARVVDEALASVSDVVWMWRDGLTIIALGSKLADVAGTYLTLDEAVAGGAVQVQEAAEQQVPTVDAITGSAMVLLLGGDTIIGGAQNRCINIDILLKPDATTHIPVSCLELGRWNTGRRFSAAPPMDYALRSMVAQQVTQAHAAQSAAPRFAANQGAIWAEIEARQHRSGFASPTRALHDVYRREAKELEDMVAAFPMPRGARGVALGLNHRLVGLDLFDSAETLERQWPRLVESAASALLDERRAVAAGVLKAPRHRHLGSHALAHMLERARSAVRDAVVTRSVGAGSDVRFAGPKVLGTALVHERRAVHVALFRPAREDSQGQ